MNWAHSQQSKELDFMCGEDPIFFFKFHWEEKKSYVEKIKTSGREYGKRREWE